MLDELYQEIILDHHKHPRCRGSIAEPDAQTKVFNPLCGDEVTVYIKVDQGKISDLKFEGKGCSISQASASIMTELCLGKSLEQVSNLHHEFDQMLKGALDAEKHPELEDAVALEGVKNFPARVRCAIIAWEALQNSIESLPSN